MASKDWPVEVTADDIALAIPASSAHCMISDALRRAYPEATHVSSDLATIRWSIPSKGKRYIALTPRPAQLALISFDQGAAPPPFHMRLRPAQIVSIRRTKDGKKGVYKRQTPPAKTGNGAVPVLSEGKPPPVGPGSDHPAAVRLGRSRRFGLRGMGH